MSDEVGCIGFAPIIKVQPLAEHLSEISEQQKYQKMWEHEEYRGVAPGEGTAPIFLSHARPKQGSEIIDFGTGTGRGALMLALMGGMKVHMLDFADNCLDQDVKDALITQPQSLSFTQHDLTKPVDIRAEYGYCTDMLEHIPPEDVDKVLTNILHASQHVFFQISCEDDKLGALIGAPLHLSVHPYAWWLEKLQGIGCVVHWSQDAGSHCLFYVTAWAKGSDVTSIGVLNVEEQEAIDNVKFNIKNGWNQIVPHETNNVEVMILAGGPSLNDHLEHIKQLRDQGVKIVTLNGTYNWALGHGLFPVNQIIVDARKMNARFTKPVREDCKYLLASQCHPSVFEGLSKEQTYIWHTSADMIKDVLKENYDIWFGIPGGSTVMLRAIPLLRMLGFKRFHLFGFDSCLREDRHHSYAQPENDDAIIVPVIVGGRVFRAHVWMISQAQEFMDLIRFFGDEIELEVYGDGLISHILKTGASLADEQMESEEDVPMQVNG